MLKPAHLLLLLLLVPGAPRPGLSQKSYGAKSLFSCIDTALSEARKSRLGDASPLSARGLPYLPSQEPSSGQDDEKEAEEDKKRTFPGSRGGSGAGSARYRFLPPAQPKGRLYPDQAKSDRRTKFTLSLDVPTNIMNILFNIAKAKNLQAKAAANALLMAQIGRKK
ncbi:urocortin-3 [Callorhinus ursinus]|uniref:Urocortin-3 n=1 Tax=Callorhinus ursinus TaxID=34884 RepID=A0A3Q7MQ96_CALUR|nr:urocortin-3 [Callorhinus ursinus]